VLQRDFDIRREQLAREMREQTIEAAKARCALAEERLAPLVAKARALSDEIEAEVRKIGRELDVFPGEYYESQEFVGPRQQKVVTTLQTRKRSPVTVQVNNSWAPSNVESQIRLALDKLGDERVQGGQSLDVLRIDLQEQLLVGELNGDAAAFLERIPTLDALLPAPAQLLPTASAGGRRNSA
jgi:hypothetical protein